MSLSQALKDVLEAPYVDNTNNNHENFTKTVLLKNGFSEVSKDNITFKDTEFWENINTLDWDKASHIPNNSLICQPFGSQKTPDKIIKYKNKLFAWEDKSSKGASPTYNGGLPKQDCLYVFTSQKHDKTTIFRGKDIITKERQQLLLDHHKTLAKLTDEFNKQLNALDDPCKRGFTYYVRAMYNQVCSHLECSNDYFLHPQRDEIEKRIVNWIEEFEITADLEKVHI